MQNEFVGKLFYIS